jgi:hypothetical protein
VHSYYPVCYFLLVGAVWSVLVVESHRLFYQFRARFPEVARREISYAFEFQAHPEKALYFFRRKSLDLLQGEPGLWKLRQRVKLLLVLAGVVPVLGFFVLIGLFLLMAG